MIGVMNPLTAERLWTIPRVGAPHALGDGRLLVPVTTYAEDDASTTTLWRVDPTDGEALWFAEGEISSPAVSRDGKTLAYLKKADDHRQVYVQALDGGEARRAADLPLGAVGVKWTPDGRLIALAVLWRDHPTLEATSGYEPPSNLEVRATESAVYQYWDEWLDHVYHPVVVDPRSGSLHDLTPGATRFWAWPATDEPIADVDVSPDGAWVAFCADDSDAPHRELSWSLFLQPIDGGDATRVDADRPGHSRRPRFTLDGRSIVYGYQAEPDYYACPAELTLYDVDGGDHRPLGGLDDRSPSGWIVAADSDLLFTIEDEGRSRLCRMAPASGEYATLTDSGWVTDPTVGPDGTVHILGHDLVTPPEIYAVDESDSTKPKRVTRFTTDALDGLDVGAVSEMMVTAAGGTPVQTWIVDPPGASPTERLPVVHMLHGGPHSASADGWHWRWNAQVLAGSGFRVAMVNFHGSTGWGDEFTRSIHGAWGDLPSRDVEAVTDHLIGAGLADPERIAITGGSYGGYLVSWIAANTDRYACVVAHAAVTELGGMYASDITYGRARAYGAEIWEDPAALQRWSPAVTTADYVTPTLVIHGQRDRRVPLTQGTGLYGVLVAKGVPARLVIYPGENHWILSRTNSIHWYQEVISWLRRWL